MIKKAEFSRVNNIGKTIWEHTITREEFYCNENGKKVLRLNKLAWESPSVYVKSNGEEVHGFVPGDEFYDEIIAELKTYEDRWRDKNVVRKIIPNSEFDVVAIWYPEVKMINFFFQKSYEYCVD